MLVFLITLAIIHLILHLPPPPLPDLLFILAQLETGVEALPLKPIADIVLMKTFVFTVHHYYFVSHSAKLDGIADVQLVALTLLKVVVLVITHVAHDKPQFVTRICLLVICIVDFEAMVYPVIIVFKHARCSYSLFWKLLFQSFVVQRGCSELVERLCYYRIFASLQDNYLIMKNVRQILDSFQ